MRKGKRAISADKATWLAIAQPSSALKWPNASASTIHARRRKLMLPGVITVSWLTGIHLPAGTIRDSAWGSGTSWRQISIRKDWLTVPQGVGQWCFADFAVSAAVPAP